MLVYQRVKPCKTNNSEYINSLIFVGFTGIHSQHYDIWVCLKYFYWENDEEWIEN